ncbi:MAG: hypothetical protein Q4G02_01665 [bacterium]|nr:hypothetical protein [bacterium]
MKKWSCLLGLILCFGFINATSILAAEKYYFFDDFLLNSNTGERVSDRYLSTSDLVNVIVRYLFIAGGVVFFALIIYSGYKLVFMGDKQKALSSVKQYLTTGVIGLAIMLAAYWIVQIIETITGLTIL